MIQSMTGYGQASCEFEDKKVSIEIKSLNSKQFDLYVRLPQVYRDKELEIRNTLNNRLRRGKVDLSLSVEYREGQVPVRINTSVVTGYYRQIREILAALDVDTGEPVMQAILRLPEALNGDKQTPDEAEWGEILQTLSDAAGALEAYRKTEGEALEKDLLMRIGYIEAFLLDIEPFEKERHEIVRQRLTDSLNEVLSPEKIDGSRFEQELIYYLEKLDITEEKTRLAHHCRYFRDVMQEDDQVGRKLGFVSQEMGREINTIGSKANHVDIQKLVVMMKDELEKIKEQLLNVL